MNGKPESTATGIDVVDTVASWIAVDWGTTNLRVWIMNERDRVMQSLSAKTGMATLLPNQFEESLLALIAPSLSVSAVTPVVCCGMVGARQGWSDAGYRHTPVDPRRPTAAHRVTTRDPRISVTIMPGVQQRSPADVMRGEETQIAGYLYQSPDYQGTLCLPGTHTKWVGVDHGMITGFQTCMSGELFSLLSRQSVLKHSMPGDSWSDDAFRRAVSSAVNQPEALAAQLFRIRADSLVDGVPEAALRARLSGLLIGAELASTRRYWAAQRVTLVGDSLLTALYTQALSCVHTRADVAPGDTLVLTGLIACYRNLQEPCS